MTDPLSDLRRLDAVARWRVADVVALRPEADAQLAAAPAHLAGWLGDEGDGDDAPEYDVVDGVAVVPVVGALMDRSSWCWDGYDEIAARAAAAHADPAVRAVVLDLDSPGGMVAGLFDCMRSLRASRAASGKPMVAWVASGAYSAAYGLAAACDTIATSDTAGTGSVGVIASLTSCAKMLKDAGIDRRVVASGEQKTDGNPAVAITPEAVARLTARVQELTGMFFAEVGAGRAALTPAALAALDGGVAYGRGALAAGLADRVTTRAALLAELAGSPRAPAATSAAPRTPAPVPGRALHSARSLTSPTSTRTPMDETLLAAIAALTGTTDPAAQAAALGALATLRTDHAALAAAHASAGATVTKLSAELGEANTRAQAAEARAEGMERAAELEGAKAAGQWTPALDGFLGALSVPQLRAWRASAPRVVPAGEVRAPADAPAADAQMPPDVAALAAKGWKALTARERHTVEAHSAALAKRLRAQAA